MKFEKATGKPSQLIELLRSRGLVFSDEEKIELYSILSKVGYYRLSGYFLPFQKVLSPHKHDFVSGTTLSQVIQLYKLDSSLRNLALELLGEIEITLRTTICEHMCSVYKPHWYMETSAFDTGKHVGVYEEAAKHVNYDLFKNQPYWQNPNPAIDRQARPLFLQHYYFKYTTPGMPPAWMLRECASFGFWARTFDCLKVGDQKSITTYWKFPDGKKIDHTILSNWLWSLSIFRNRCAHHSRIVQRNFPFAPVVPSKNPAKDLFNPKTDDLRTLFVIIQILMRCIDANNPWRTRLAAILSNYTNNNLDKATGFSLGNSSSWDKTPFWNLYP